MIRNLKRNCVDVISSWWILNLKWRTQGVPLCNRKPLRKTSGRKTRKFPKHCKICSTGESTFGFTLKDIEDGKLRYSYAHNNKTQLDRSKLLQ